MNVVIVGAGWAGLAAAVELSRNNIGVTVLETARQVGGRARAVRFGDYRIDNGQHILLGAYTSVLQLLQHIDVPEDQVFKRIPLLLQIHAIVGPALNLRAPGLPAPLHLLMALFRCGLSLRHKLAALRLIAAMRLNGFELEQDCSVLNYLKRHRQTQLCIQQLWEPLCIAALNTPIDQASNNLFMAVIRDAFFGSKKHSDMLLPRVDLGACLPQPAMDYIETRGGSVQLATRVRSLEIQDHAVTGVASTDTHYPADHVIIATAPEACVQLLRQTDSLTQQASQIAQLGSCPIVTLYLHYPDTVGLDSDFIGLVDGTVQWLFDRGRLMQEPGMLAAVISGPGKHMDMSIEQLTAAILRDIARHFPHWPAPLKTKLIREKRATLNAVADIAQQRPGSTTPVRGLWLAGDYTDTGYPSTLEGAVRSGLHCAHAIIEAQANANT